MADRPARILVIEDEPTVWALLCRILKAVGHHVLEAETEWDALELTLAGGSGAPGRADSPAERAGRRKAPADKPRAFHDAAEGKGPLESGTARTVDTGPGALHVGLRHLIAATEISMGRDDLPIGRVLSRREALTVLGASGLALLAGDTHRAHAFVPSGHCVPGCVARPEQTEGPYFVDRMLKRSDIRSDPGSGAIKEGTPLALTLAVSALRAGSCAPLKGAHVDIWHCDAAGVYSGVEDPGFNTVGQSFLRGYQLTDDAGEARFLTIYPGWYAGRTVHIHFKIRTDPAADRGHDFTSQLYFDDDVTTRVLSKMPYAAKAGRRDRNADDRIFTDGGEQLLLGVRPSGEGYSGRFEVGLQL